MFFFKLQRCPTNGDSVTSFPLQKQDNIQNCNNYRSIKLFNHTMKLLGNGD